MKQYFTQIPQINFVGDKSTNEFAYRFYDKNRLVLGKTMAEHLRAAVCYWHTFCWEGQDTFGGATFPREWNHSTTDDMNKARAKADAAFELTSKLDIDFFTFHDCDMSPEGDTLKESINNLKIMTEYVANKMSETKIKLLWGTANLFSNKRYMAGAATNPNPEVFAYAISQAKAAIDATMQLDGANYVFWGGREGYDTLLNTNLKQEFDQLAKFFHLLVEYKHKIGYKGTFLIEPKPCEPTKHQYDYDSATTFAFLQKYGLEKEFKLNIEANHATLSGHTFSHEIAYACTNGIMGSIDANQGDAQLGWDTDQFPSDIAELVKAMLILVRHGGFTTGGFNFDVKLRRQSMDIADLFYGFIGGMDNLAKSLLIVEKIINDKSILTTIQDKRYSNWQDTLGSDILSNKMSVDQISEYVINNNLNPLPSSGKQEYLENKLNYFMY